MTKINFNEPKMVLVFNASRILIAIVRSLHSAAQLSAGNLQSISFCCNGLYISSGGFYFRHVHTNIEIDVSDLDSLRLEEYDILCGEKNRRYHSRKEMVKKRVAKTKKAKDKTKKNKRK